MMAMSWQRQLNRRSWVLRRTTPVLIQATWNLFFIVSHRCRCEVQHARRGVIKTVNTVVSAPVPILAPAAIQAGTGDMQHRVYFGSQIQR